MRTYVAILVLSFVVGFSVRGSQNPEQVDKSRPTAVTGKTSTPVDCSSPNGFSLEEVSEPGTHYVNVVSNRKLLHTIKLQTDAERNGFAFDGMKQTKDGFELAIEYGSVIFYAKRFIFTCRQHRFYLSKIQVDSFNRHDPEKGFSRVIRVKPNVPLEKFSITDFMLEGVMKSERSN